MSRIILPIAALLFGIIVVGCDDETETGVKPGSAQFENSTLLLFENSARTAIVIAFDKSATDQGEISIQIISSNAERFQFEPAPVNGIIHVPYTKGQTKASFYVTSLDNDVLDGDQTLDFSIVSISPGFVIGSSKTLSTTWKDNEARAQVNFLATESLTVEDKIDGYPITISFSHATTADGVVQISIHSDNAEYGTHFTTEPAVSHGLLTLPIEAGKSFVTFKVFSIDDELYNQQRSISYTIAEATGGLEKGGVLRHEWKITDDELQGTGKAYEIIAGSWKYKRRFEYNEDGKLSKVLWDQHTPGHSGGVYTYVYNNFGQVEKIIQSAAREEKFIREGDRIVKSEEYTNGVLTKYTLYGYDDAGNVGEAAVHYKQPDGSIVLSLVFVYLYHSDHNIYKIMSYNASAGPEDLVLIGTKTYDYYLPVENPFPMVEIIPDQKAQTKLPSVYRVEENGHDITYQLSYQFTNDGKPISRSATSSAKSETAYYEYY